MELGLSAANRDANVHVGARVEMAEHVKIPISFRSKDSLISVLYAVTSDYRSKGKNLHFQILTGGDGGHANLPLVSRIRSSPSSLARDFCDAVNTDGTSPSPSSPTLALLPHI